MAPSRRHTETRHFKPIDVAGLIVGRSLHGCTVTLEETLTAAKKAATLGACNWSGVVVQPKGILCL